MYRWFYLGLFYLSFSGFAQVQDSLTIQSDVDADHEAHTLLVRVNPNIKGIASMELNREVAVDRLAPEIQSLFEDQGVKQAMRISDTPDGQKWFKIKLSETENLQNAIRRLLAREDIIKAERSPIYHSYVSAEPEALLNDTYNYLQYQFASIYAHPAIDYMKDKGETIVAIVDDALLYTHEDLRDNIYYNEGERGMDSQGRDKRSNGIDDDGNGFIDDFRGWDFSNWDNDITPPLDKAYYSRWGHGTFIGGIIGAVTNNGKGISAISDNHIKIMGLKCAADQTDARSYYRSDLAPAIKYAADNGAQVINMSWGSTTYSSYLRSFLQYAFEKNVVLVASAGNDNSSGVHYPSSYPEVISVGSLTSNDQKSSFSNFGPYVDIYAPGSSLYSTRPYYKNPNGVYGYGSGTSYSAPIVAAASGLLKILEPNMNTDMVRHVFTSSADNIDDVNSIDMGNGKLNLYRSLGAIDDLKGILEFSLAGSVIYPGMQINIKNSSILIDESTYEWHFPGSSSEYSNEPEPQVTYDKPGVYRFSVTAKDKQGNLFYSEKGNTIIVEAPSLETNVLGYVSSEYERPDSIVTNFTQDNVARKFYLDEDAWLLGFYVVVYDTYERYGRLQLNISEDISSSTKAYFRFDEEDLMFSNEDELIWNFLTVDEPVQLKKGQLFISSREYGYNFTSSQSVPFIPSNEEMYHRIYGKLNQKGTPLLMPAISKSNPYKSTIKANRDNVCIGDTIRAEIENFNPSVEYIWWMAAADVHFKGNRMAQFSFDTMGRRKISLRSTFNYSFIKFNEPFNLKFQAENSASFNVLDCDAPPEVWFTARPRDWEDNRGVRINAGKKVNFSNESSNYTKIRWYFEGGDPQYSEVEKPVVTYDKPGNYRVELKAKQFNGEYTKLLRKAYVAVDENPWHTAEGSDEEVAYIADGIDHTNNLIIYPNPNQEGMLHITGIEENTEIEIVSMNGKLLSSHKASPGIPVNISNLGQGLYLVQVHSKDGKIDYLKLIVE